MQDGSGFWRVSRSKRLIMIGCLLRGMRWQLLSSSIWELMSSLFGFLWPLHSGHFCECSEFFFNSFPFDRLVGLKSCHGGLQEKRGNSFFFCRRAALYSATLFDCGSETWPLNNATVGQAGYCTFNFSNVKSSIIHRWLMRYSPLSTQCIQASTCVERWLHSIFVFFIYLSFLCMYI